MRPIIPLLYAAVFFGLFVSVVSVLDTQTVAQTQHAASAATTCADERDAMDSERNYPGALLDMAKETLAACERLHPAAE